jgi:hypothetical protein
MSTWVSRTAWVAALVLIISLILYSNYHLKLANENEMMARKMYEDLTIELDEYKKMVENDQQKIDSLYQELYKCQE